MSTNKPIIGHIMMTPPIPVEKVKAVLANLDKHQRRYLKNWICAYCEQNVSHVSCGVLLDDDPCTEEDRIARIKFCLGNYKPRPNRRKISNKIG